MSGELHRPEGEDEDALIARLEVIEEQPLGERAGAYAQVHESLRLRLEGNDRHAGG